jgi:N-acetylmuramoyl-L-alanine amidase
MVAAFLLIAVVSQPVAWAATAESRYYAAESCAKKLRDNPQQQKYRDRWITCIQKYLAVYREDPHGPWAAAGLYRAGDMYAELYQLNQRESDRREALDLLHSVVKNYPDSRYREQARQSAENLKGGTPEPQVADAGKPKTADAALPLAEAPKPKEAKKLPPPSQAAVSAQQWYDKAQRQERRLREETKLQKQRDQWFKAIHAYRQVLQAEPGGPLTPAALYGMGSCYAGMYKWSHTALDRLQSEKAFQELIGSYPESLYADKARAELGPAAGPAAESGGDAISEMISSAQSAPAPTQSSSRTASTQQPAIIEGLRFWSNPRYTRVVIDANADTTFSFRELREDPNKGKPQRIYIDVHNSRLSQNLQKVMPINDNLLSDARAGQYANDTVRVVVDTKSSQSFKIFSLKNPYRIVLDVWGVENGVAATKPVPKPEPEPDTAASSSKKLPPSAIVKQLALGVRRIVIDPGHGGKDFGAPGAIKGVHEKQVVLAIAQRLAKKIRADLQCEVILTRNSDTYLSLEERTAIANTQNADLFISIHTNASPNPQAYGIETFILNLATDDEAIRVAARENATSTKNISDLDSILQDLMQNAKVSESTRLASYVQQEVMGNLRKRYDPLRDKGVKKAPFYVLLGAQMPSILVETAFISNARECKWLMADDYQERLCQGIVMAIRRYIEDTNPVAWRRPAKAGKKG